MGAGEIRGEMCLCARESNVKFICMCECVCVCVRPRVFVCACVSVINCPCVCVCVCVCMTQQWDILFNTRDRISCYVSFP